MKELEKDILCVLLQILLGKKLITQDVHDQSRNMVLSTSSFPEFFCKTER